MLAAVVAALCFTGCSGSEDKESIYEIVVSVEGENGKMISNKDTDVQNAYNLINTKLSDLSKEVADEWVEKGNADKAAKEKFAKAKDRLDNVVKECEDVIGEIPAGSTGTFVISEALLLRKVSAGTGTETLDKSSFTLRYPAK